MIQPLHYFHLPVDFLQVARIQLWLIDYFDCNLATEEEREVEINYFVIQFSNPPLNVINPLSGRDGVLKAHPTTSGAN